MAAPSPTGNARQPVDPRSLLRKVNNLNFHDDMLYKFRGEFTRHELGAALLVQWYNKKFPLPAAINEEQLLKQIRSDRLLELMFRQTLDDSERWEYDLLGWSMMQSTFADYEFFFLQVAWKLSDVITAWDLGERIYADIHRDLREEHIMNEWTNKFPEFARLKDERIEGYRESLKDKRHDPLDKATKALMERLAAQRTARNAAASTSNQPGSPSSGASTIILSSDNPGQKAAGKAKASSSTSRAKDESLDKTGESANDSTVKRSLAQRPSGRSSNPRSLSKSRGATKKEDQEDKPKKQGWLQRH